jgi:hypothetical protein
MSTLNVITKEITLHSLLFTFCNLTPVTKLNKRIKVALFMHLLINLRTSYFTIGVLISP